jgi:hypothetical protein
MAPSANAQAPPGDPYQERMSAGHRVQPPRSRPPLPPQAVGRIKAAIAFAGALVLLWGALAPAAREAPSVRRARAGALLLLATAAAWGGWNFGAFHYPDFGHATDSYRRYLGAKYAAELGYERLYGCAAVADVEAGLRDWVERRYPRVLATDDPAAGVVALAQPDTCKSHFAPERWASFQSDVAWFRDGVDVRRWQEIQAEPGYSATPAWTALARPLANLAPPAALFALLAIDLLLLALLWGAVAFAFGWPAACVGLLFWGTNPAAGFDATGGSLLRQPWLAACVLAICALRRGWPATAGALLGAASALEGFPLLVLAAFGVQAIAASIAERRVSLAPELRRLFAGALASAGLLFAASLAVGGGLAAWGAWLSLREARLAVPPGGAIGLHVAIGSTPAFLALLASYVALLARVAARAAAWEVGVLGLGFVLIAGTVPAWASAGLLAFGLLAPGRPAIGIALCGLALAGWLLAGSGPPSPDWLRWISFACAAFVAGATALLLQTRRAA